MNNLGNFGATKHKTMKLLHKTFAILAAAAALSTQSCGVLSQVNIDSQSLSNATAYAATAMLIDDATIAQLSTESVASMDAQATIDNGSYKERLDKLTANLKGVEGMNLNFKVYKTQEINAFACGDGSIRVYSGLMDVMDDSELIAIIGHEIGHVKKKDTKKALKQAYLNYAGRQLLAGSGTMVGALSASVLGDLTDTFLTSQYSKMQEYRADRSGFQFAVDNGYSPYSMANALNVLVSLNDSASTSGFVAQMFASHPNSEKRAKKMTKKAQEYEASHK